MSKEPTKKKKPKVVYREDTGETIYSMAALNGETPEEQEERIRRKKNGFVATGKEKRAMIAAAFAVYGPLLLIIVGAFLLTALFMYFFWL